jgi:peroxiredoxin
MSCRTATPCSLRESDWHDKYVQMFAPTQFIMERRQNMTSSDILQAGVTAPDFELRSGPNATVKLSDLRGRPVILAFYPADFSPVCGDQIALYNEVLGEFKDYGAEILGISVDSVWCHAAFAKQKNIHFPLLADFEPKGEVGRRYGAYRAQDGTEERALFVVDRDGRIHWSYLSPVDINPGADGILDALDSLRARERAAASPEIMTDVEARP